MNNYLRLRAHLLYVTTRSIFSHRNSHPLLYAAKHNYLDVVKHLIEHGVESIHKIYVEALHYILLL
ncbi:ankyrin repeat family protein [Orientia tsutsugamushi str. UT76]|nr:ankyrin repeat family protein [Orientia tsutsugamushi str. UT76]SPR11556.1 Uncharacterised protein [Orientia tsutsugamushi]